MFIWSSIAHLIALTSPGPDTAVTIRQVMLHGRNAGIYSAIGIGVGIYAHCLLAINGISLLVLSNELYKLIIIIFLLFSSLLLSQKIYSVDYSYQADFKVFVVEYPYQADLKIYRVDYDYKAKGNSGLWFFVKNQYQADKKIFYTDYEYQSDLKIYFVKYNYQAGWNKSSKKHLLY